MTRLQSVKHQKKKKCVAEADPSKISPLLLAFALYVTNNVTLNVIKLV